MTGIHEGLLEVFLLVRFAHFVHVHFSHESSSIHFLHFQPVQFLDVLLQFWFRNPLIHLENYHIRRYLFIGSRPMQEKFFLKKFVFRVSFGEVAVGGDLHIVAFTSKP